MKKFKKTVGVLLILSLAAGLLACGDSGSATTSPAAEESAPGSEAAAPETAEEPEAVEPESAAEEPEELVAVDLD